MKHITSTVACAVSMAVMCMLAIPAAAQNSKREPFTVTLTNTIDCTYGQVQVTTTFNGVDIVFFDSSGFPTRIQSHETLTTTFSNPLNGKSVSGTSTQNETNVFPTPGDFSTVFDIERGEILAVNVGGGTFQLAGRIVREFSNNTVTITAQTPHAVPSDQQTFNAAICAALQ